MQTLLVALTHQNRREPEISIDHLLNPGILIHAEIKRTWAEFQIISDIHKKSSHNSSPGKEEFALHSVESQCKKFAHTKNLT